MATLNGFQLQYYESVIDSIPIGTLALNSELVLVSINPAAATILGCTVQEAIGFPLESLLDPMISGDAAHQLVCELKSVLHDQHARTQELTLAEQVIALKASPLTDAQKATMGVVVMLEDITERKRTEQRIQRRAEQLTLLYDAGLTLNRVLDLRQQLKAIFAIGLKAVQAERADFFRYDPVKQVLQVELTHHYADEDVPPALRSLNFPLGTERGLVGWVAARREMFYLPEVTADPRWITVDPTVRSAIWVPLEYEQRLLGVLCVSSTLPNAFLPDDQRLLEMFARQAAAALEKTRLFEEIQLHLAELEAVNQATSALRMARTLDEILPPLLSVTLDALRATRGNIRLYDKKLATLTVAAAQGYDAGAAAALLRPEEPGLGRAGAVYTTEEPLIIGETGANGSAGSETAAFASLIVPLRAGDHVIGVFTVDRTPPSEWTPNEVGLLITLSEIGGATIQRSTLHQQTERRLQYLTAARDVSRAIAGSFDLRVNLAVVLVQAIAQLNATAASVLLLNTKSHLLEFAAGRGFRTKAIENTRLRLGESHAGRAALERRLVQVADLTDGGNQLPTPNLSEEGFVCYFGVPLIAKGQVKGVLEIFKAEAFDPDEEWLDFLHALAGQAAIAVDNASLFNDLQRSNFELTQAYDATIEGWSRALDLRDRETEGHTQRVTEMTLRLARACGVREDELLWFRWGALLHDIGKIGIPDAILHKPGPLTEEERDLIRQHPVFAYELLAPIRYLRSALDIPYSHHERWDGTGYPLGLRGEEIPLAARIFALADVWDALRSHRTYHPAWSHDMLVQHIHKQSGSHFDPKIATVFLDLLQANGAGAQNG